MNSVVASPVMGGSPAPAAAKVATESSPVAAGGSALDVGVGGSSTPRPVLLPSDASDVALADGVTPRRVLLPSDASDVGLADSVTPRPVRLPSRKALMISAAALIVVLAVATFGHHWWTVGRFVESTDDAYVGGDITVIAPKVSGFISRVAVTDNQQVHAGDVLVELDNRDYVAARARAVAAVAAQEAAITNLKATRHLQEAVIAQAQAGINAADAEIERSQEDQVRYHRLEKLSAVSTQESQKADADYKNAIAAGAKARAALAASQRELDVIDSRSQQATAALAQAKADRDVADLNLSYTELRAPIDGTVGNRSARAGSYATIGAQMMSLVPARGLWVDANFKESQVAHMRAGQPVTVEADVLPGRVFHGHVASLAPATGAVFSVLPAENATGNFTKIVQRVPVRVILDGAASQLGQLRPGLSVIAAVDMHSSASNQLAASRHATVTPPAAGTATATTSTSAIAGTSATASNSGSAGTSATSTSATGTSATGTFATSTSATGTSATSTSATSTSATSTSATSTSATGTSATGTSATGTSATVAAN